ncbi:MAG: hypothetical protein ABEJ06_05050 [Haloarculaceae archaeon]
MTGRPRRGLLRATGATLTAAVLGVGRAGGASGKTRWRAVDSPTSNSLDDVCHATTGAFAVGADGTVLRK